MNQAVRHVQGAETDIVAVSEHAPRISNPICFVIDPKPGINLLVSNVCEDLGIHVHRFENFADMVEAGQRISPSVIFLEPGIHGRDGDDVIPGARRRGLSVSDPVE